MFIRNKKSNAVFYLSFLFIVLFSAGLQQGHDYNNYYNSYVSRDIFHSYAIGFGFIENIAINLNFDFRLFYSFSVIFSTILIFFVVKKSNTDFHFFTVVYMLYYIFLNAQLKNQIGLSFFLLGIYCLYRLKRINGILLFLAFTLLAASFHPVFLLYFIFVLVRFKRLNKVIRFLSVVSVIAIIVSFVFKEIGFVKTMGSYFLSMLGESRYEDYFSTSTRFGALPIIIISLLMVYLSYFNQKNVLIDRRFERGFSRNESIQMVYYISLLSLLFVPLVTVNVTFYRIIRNLSLVVILFTVTFKSDVSSITCKKPYFVSHLRICSLMIVVLFFFFDVVLKGYSSTFYYEHFGNNLFILG